MKYNPYINDYAASLRGFEGAHPEAPIEDCQASLEVIHANQELFRGITGMAAVTTQPVAGAQGELVGLKMFLAYFRDKGDRRDVLLIPQSAHGTNPATAACVGFLPKPATATSGGICLVSALPSGEMDITVLRSMIRRFDRRIAGMMITNPNTSGIFETRFKQVADMIHQVGGLIYMDGANMNAIAGRVNLAKMGVDAVHNNTHKTWSIPHGGGGPGDAFVGVSESLRNYLPGHQVIQQNGKFSLYKPSQSIGSVHRHFGNVAHKVRSYTYLCALGKEGVRRMSGMAVLSSRYVETHIKKMFPLLPRSAGGSLRLHEFIITIEDALFQKIIDTGIPKGQVIPRIGKLFLDFGFHAPTVSFPEPFGMTIEPTESYTKAELDRFISALQAMKTLITHHPRVLHTTPHFTPIGRIDEVTANKNLCLTEPLNTLPEVFENRLSLEKIAQMDIPDLVEKILDAHHQHVEELNPKV